MLNRPRLLAGLSACFCLATACVTAQGPTYTDPDNADADFAFQGEYTGGSGARKTGAQVIALGDGQFDVVVYPGGLPGEGWDGKTKETLQGSRDGDVVTIGDTQIKDGRWKRSQTLTLEKVQRRSPTLGAQPPTGAVVLFDGTSAERFQNGKMTEDHLLQQGCTSKQKFGSHKLHIEFQLPYKPQARGQARGNSGVYLQGRYEVQMLDSFGLEGKQNECGGIYSVSEPAVNMCFPPLSWQTYDIDFTAATYDGEGRLVSNPRVTVRHNGVVIHDDQELPGERNTTAAPVPAGPEPGPVYLQDHGNPVRYRNIWVVETR
jgi:hypothetical protein